MPVKPVFLYLAVFSAGVLILAVSLLPWYLEYTLEENDLAWTGREIEVEDVDLNLFTGRVEIEDARMYEEDSEEIFVRFDRLEARFSVWPALLRTVADVEYIRLENPVVVIEENGPRFNFDDLTEHLAGGPEEPADTAAGPPEYIIRDIVVSGGTLIFRDIAASAELTLENIGIAVPYLRHDDPVIQYRLALQQKEGGDLTVDGQVNPEDMENMNHIVLTDWSLRPYRNYLNAYLNISDFDASAEADLFFGGNYREDDQGYVSVSGTTTLKDFLLVDNNLDSLIRFSSTTLEIDSVHTGTGLYDVGQMRLENPRVLFKYFKTTDNFSTLYTPAEEEILDTIRVRETEIVFENPFQYVADYLSFFLDEDILQSFQLDSAVMKQGTFIFQDFSKLEEAVLRADNFNARMDRISRDDSLLGVSFDSKINQSGELLGELKVERGDFQNFGLGFDLQNVYISAFDAYSKHYTAYPLWEGTLNVSSQSDVRNRKLTSENRLLIMQPEVGKRLDMDAEYKIPLRFAFGLLKDVEGNVDIRFPVEGDLDDPEYKVGPVILKVFMNLLSKAVASPYKLLARSLDADEEDLKAIRFNNNQDSLAAPQTRSLNLMVRVLENKEDLNARLEYLFNEKEERDQVALMFAKERFLSELADSLRNQYTSVESVENTDSLFAVFLNQQTGKLGQVSAAAMSREVMGTDNLEKRISFLKQQQHQLVRDYLFLDKALDSTRVAILDNTDPAQQETVIRPTFRITYDAGEFEADTATFTPHEPPDESIPAGERR